MKTVQINTYAVVGEDKHGGVICERGLSLHQAKLRATKRKDECFLTPKIYKDKDISMNGEIPVINFNCEYYLLWNELYKKWEKC